MPYKDNRNPKWLAYRKAYYERTKNSPSRRASCRKATYKWRERHPEFYAELKKEYYNDNREDILKKQKQSYQKNIKKRHAYEKKKVADLTDCYMKKHLLKLGYTRQNIRKYPDLIETHKLIIKTKRL